jgi:hypothetical protein
MCRTSTGSSAGGSAASSSFVRRSTIVLHAVVDERGPALVAQLADAVGADDRVVARLAAVLGRMAAEVADVEQSRPRGGRGYAATAASCFALECRRRCVVDAHVSRDLPVRSSPAKFTVVLRRVRPRRSDASVRLGPSTSTSSTPPTRSRFLARAESCTASTSRSIALLVDLLGDLIRRRGGLGACRGRVHEGEGAFVTDLLDDFDRLLEVALGLAREADDDVRRQREVGIPARRAPTRRR